MAESAVVSSRAAFCVVVNLAPSPDAGPDWIEFGGAALHRTIFLDLAIIVQKYVTVVVSPIPRDCAGSTLREPQIEGMHDRVRHMGLEVGYGPAVPRVSIRKGFEFSPGFPGV